MVEIPRPPLLRSTLRRGMDRFNIGLVAATLATLLWVLRACWNLDDHFITRREFQDAMTEQARVIDLRATDLQHQLDRIERNTRRER